LDLDGKHGDPNKFNIQQHAVRHVKAANIKSLSVKARPKIYPLNLPPTSGPQG
jgi:hypothetical protein